jgi:transcriptional regulator with XRE-family HTH domain
MKALTPTKRVCLRLKEARLARGLSLAQLSKNIRISKKYIAAMEECRFDELPFAPVYQKNLIKAYIRALDHDPKAFVDQFVSEELAEKDIRVPTSDASRHARLLSIPLLLKFAGIGLLFIAVVGYLLAQVHHIVEPPQLLVYSPDNGFVTHDARITVHGKVDKGAFININGKHIMSSEDGFFEEDITLSQGVNTIVLSAKKRYGKPITQTRHIIYTQAEAITFDRQSPTAL